MSALANFVFTLLPRGSYLIGPFNASGKNRPLDAFGGAVDDIENLPSGSIEGDGVVSRRRIAREAPEKRTVHGVAQIGDHRSGGRANAKIILIPSS